MSKPKIVKMYDEPSEGADLKGAGRDVSTPSLTGEELKSQLETGPLNIFTQIIFRPGREITIGKARPSIDPKNLGKDDSSFNGPESI